MPIGTGWLLRSSILNVSPNDVSPMISNAWHWNKDHKSTVPYQSVVWFVWTSLSILQIRFSSVSCMYRSREFTYLMENAGDRARLYIDVTKLRMICYGRLTLNLWNAPFRVLNIHSTTNIVFSYYNLSENMVVLYSILTWYLGIIGSFHKIILDEDLLNHFFIGYSNVLRIQAHN